MRSRLYRLAAIAALFSASAAQGWAQSTVTYTYDTLGRLVMSSYASGPYQAYAYDAADNRTHLTMDTSPPAPTAVDDSALASGSWANPGSSPSGLGVAPTVTIDPRSNDTSPLGYGFTVTGVTQGASGTVTFTGTSVHYTYGTHINTTWSDADSFTYTVSDGHGGTATATVYVDIEVAATCGGIACI
jgi:YD repeat-containing protein